MLILRIFFCVPQSASASSNSKNVQDGVGSKAEISRTFSRDSPIIADVNQDNSPQSESVPEGTQRVSISIRTPSGNILSVIPRGGDNNLPSPPGKFGPGSKAKGAAKRNFARQQAGKTPTSGRSGGGFFTNAFTAHPQFPNRLRHQFECFRGNDPNGGIQPQCGKDLRIKSVSFTDENGEKKTTYYDRGGNIIDGPEESGFLVDADLERDSSPNPTDQQIQSETKSQAEDAQNQNSGLTKARDTFTKVKDEKLTGDGRVSNSSKLTSKGRSFIEKTKDRRTSPLLQSRYEDKDKDFSPAYSLTQVPAKRKHSFEALDKLNTTVKEYLAKSETEKLVFDIDLIETLLGHPDTEIYPNVMGQGREPLFMALNRGHGDYLIPNHIATFERQSEVTDLNLYISNYRAKKLQIKGFDLSNSTEITYENVTGQSHTNIGPVLGKQASPTSALKVDDANSEL